MNKMLARLKHFLKRDLGFCPLGWFVVLKSIKAQELQVGDRIAYGFNMHELKTVHKITFYNFFCNRFITIEDSKGYSTYRFDDPVYLIM
jgi:hypothetical protein